jgi:hypothetical protein
MSDPDAVIRELRDLLTEESGLADLLARSLAKAREGEEFGYFQFGGSDIIILFQEGTDPQIDTRDDFRLVGTPIARCSRR